MLFEFVAEGVEGIFFRDQMFQGVSEHGGLAWRGVPACMAGTGPCPWSDGKALAVQFENPKFITLI